MIKKLLFAAFLVVLSAVAYAQGTILWSEDFETTTGTALPAGWTQATSATDGGWVTGTTSFHSSQYFPIPARAGRVLGTNDDKCNCNKANENLYMPTMDFSALAPGSPLVLLFDIVYGKRTDSGKAESLKMIVSTDGGTTWTDLLTFDGGGGWRSYYSVNISAYAGMANVKFGFRYDDGTGWLYGAMLDNMRVVVPDNIIRASLTGVTAGKYIDAVPAISTVYDKILPGHEVAVRGTFNNTGFPVITSFDVDVTQNGTTQTYNYTGLNLALGRSVQFYVPYQAVLGANAFDFSVVVKNVNGVGDNDPLDNAGTATFNITGVEPKPGRKVVIEEATGTWCTWCPRGTVMMDYIAEQYPDLAVPIAVHNAQSSWPDPMQNAVYNLGMVGTQAAPGPIGGFPGGLVEREDDIDPLLGNPNFEKSLIEHLIQPAKVLVSQNVAWDAATRKVDVTTSLQFVEEMNGDFGIAVVFVENDVKGSTQYYGQINAYAGGANGPMGGYENLPNPVPAAQMTYQHVGREIVGGFKGAAGSVPASNPAGSVMSFTSTYTVPAAYNIDKMHAVSMLIDRTPTHGRIINAESTPIPFVSTSAPSLTVENIRISIAPNPVADEAMLTVNVEKTADVQIRVVDALGRVVSERNYANISGKQFLPFRADNLSNGMYTLVATANGQVTSKTFVVQR